jgi:hypothetical protein
MAPPKIPRERLERVEALYLGAHTDRQIQKIVAQEYGVTPRMVRNYIKLVRDRLAEQVRGIDPEIIRARVDGMLLSAYRAAELGSMDKGPDAKAMVQAAKAIGDLYGVMAPKKFEHSGPGGKAINVTDPNAVDELVRKHFGQSGAKRTIEDATGTDGDGTPGD